MRSSRAAFLVATGGGARRPRHVAPRVANPESFPFKKAPESQSFLAAGYELDPKTHFVGDVRAR